MTHGTKTFRNITEKSLRTSCGDAKVDKENDSGGVGGKGHGSN